MQAYNDDRLYKAFVGRFEELEQKKKELEEKGLANRFVIGELPDEGSEVEINGLKFYVYSRTEGGTVVLKLKKIG